ncbi:DUF4411 family protein [Quadrisphaera setariae]|uniref:DUF4411 family protein n=1 Tax=Quadrisphaera setariae TaxID=2593304 RepID=A0A5C8YZH8_9ACTN|nr:DUF4411 family protein [Quadrisphaera setariae]TXR51265.1 DUF4411 family protein [Quadrisphaera setariae]
MTLYSFDTSSFLNGIRDLLPPSVLPTLWTNVEDMIRDGSICSVDLVKDELKKRDDETLRWVKAQPKLFVPLEQDVQAAVGEVLRRHPRLIGVGSGRSGADPFVVALAHARNGVVVTEETATGNIERPRIPDVCRAMGIPHMNLIGFVKAQGWVFR